MLRVELLDFPLETMRRAQQHSEEVLREFQLIAHSIESDDARVPKRLLELAAHSDERYAGLNPHAEDEVDAAIAEGREYVDLEVWVPPTFKDDTFEAVPVLLEVEEYCRSGQLLTLLPTDDVRAFWVWYLSEFVRQIDGEAPVSWRQWSPPEAFMPSGPVLDAG
ncbi:MAG: hypothetical protein JWL83_159 [Actinomycetia bacterium]|jgi:hypothetical protein|nr:hypothetical protein [Actinomycetes bacterium]